MCLSIAIRRPNHVLAQGIHAGHEWMVVHNGMGYRCGYVKVAPGHPWHGKDYHDVACEVHGGLTFAEHDEPCGAGGPDKGYWLGFDCAHADDAPDPALLSHPSMFGLAVIYSFSAVRSQEYVEAECRSLCEQAQAAV